MKDQILKIAGVKSEKEFYKKYPTEEAFMKAHGKAFKKAAMGKNMVYEQLNQLTEFQDGGYLSTYTSPSAPDMSALSAKLSNPGFQQQAINNAESVKPKSEGFDTGAMVATGLQSIGQVIGGIEAMHQQTQNIRKAGQAKQLSGLALQAQQTMQKPKRKYVRPEDSLVQPGQLGNPYGSGTNYLAENGTMIGGNPTEIQNMYNPGDMYTDLGFEPMGETLKQYKHGGDMPKAEFGEYFQDSGQAQIGSAIGGTIGSAFGPAGQMAGQLIGKVAGNLLGGAKDARELAKNKAQAESNQQQAAFSQVQKNQFGAYMKDGGWVSNDWQPQTITKFGDYDVKDLLKPPHDADMLRSGGHLAQVGYTAPSAAALSTERPDMPQAQFGIVTSPLNMAAAAGLDAVGRHRLKNMLKEAPQLLGAMDNGGRMTSTNMMFDTDRYPRAEDGIQMAMGGDLKVGDGGHLETIAYNPNLPGGEIGMFRGASHDNGGIDVQFGENGVEVEGGEPAVKLADGGSPDGNLVVFGNIKIKKNIADLMGDPKAKDKKFKHYVADIAKNDKKQAKTIDKALDIIENANNNSKFGQLGMQTGKLMKKGAEEWQEINANKIKQAGIVQNAILDTASELGVKSDMLAEGKLEKEHDPRMMAKYGKKLQNGSIVDYLKSVGKKSDFASRKVLAKAMGIDNYSGTAKQNIGLLKKLSDTASNTASDVYVPPTPVELTDNRSRNYALEPFTQSLDSTTDFVDETGGDLENSPVGKTLPTFKGLNLGQKALAALKMAGKATGKGIDKYGPTLLSNLAPFLRPTNADEGLPPDQLYPEYFALATNQVEPVQAQTYQPMLDTPYDISLNDQINAVDSQARAAIRAAGNNPAAQAQIMAQALEAKNKVLGEQTRINTANKMQVYDKNRALLNDAQLKNLQILDQQYVRQAQAKSNTKEQAFNALSSIAAKTAQQRATNRKLAVMENMYNFRFTPSGRAVNVNPLAQFSLDGSGSFGRSSSRELAPGYGYTYDEAGQIIGTRKLPKSNAADIDVDKNGGKTSKTKARNSSIVKALKNL